MEGEHTSKKFFSISCIVNSIYQVFPIFINKYMSNAKIIMGDNLRDKPFSLEKYKFIYNFYFSLFWGQYLY